MDFGLDSWTHIGAILSKTGNTGGAAVLNGEGTNPLNIHGQSLALCHTSSNTSGFNVLLTEHIGISA